MLQDSIDTDAESLGRSHVSSGEVNHVGALLGNYKWGYTDVWCNMTESGGPNGCRALALRLVVEYASAQEDTVLTTFAAEYVDIFYPTSDDVLADGEIRRYWECLDIASASTLGRSPGRKEG